MERLSGLDASFLYLETPTLHMHVSMATILDPSTIPGGYRFERFRDMVAERLVTAPVFRRRLVQVPLGLGHPYWIEDGAFDIDYHVRRRALPAPGGLDELAEFVGDVCGRQLDRARPLWQMYVVEGLAGGRVAVVTKIHHATIDGVSGAELLGRLFDLSPDAGISGGPTQVNGADPGQANGADPAQANGAPPGDGDRSATNRPWLPPRRVAQPPDAVVLARALLDRATRPLEAGRLALRTGRAVVDVVRLRRSAHTGQGHGALPLTTPRTSLNAAITPHRKVAFASTSLDDVKLVKRHLGCTVNDVVLAMCTGALRDYLQRRNELPEEPLVATVPVSVEPSQAAHMHGSNKVSAMWVALPCAVADPIERVEQIRASTRGAKDEYRALGADVLVNWTEHASPNLFSAAARMYSRLRLADRHRPIHSLVISNVPGPDFPIYLGGAETVAAFPLGPITDGAGLNITVMSYRGVLNWGLMACRETVPEVGTIADGLADTLAELMAACGLGRPHRVGLAPPRSASRRVGTRRRAPAAGAVRPTSAPDRLAGPAAGTPGPTAGTVSSAAGMVSRANGARSRADGTSDGRRRSAGGR